MRFSARALLLSLFLLLVSVCTPSLALAQGNVTSQSGPANLNPYTVPNTDPDVPANQNTRVQSLMIDIATSFVCIMSGINAIDHTKPCLDINPETRKIGYNKASLDENGQPRLGGLIGATSNMISVMYTPTINTGQYTRYLANNFSIVKPAYAQDAGYGFKGLDSLLLLWTAIRNVAYFLLMIAFLLIGLGVMLRFKVDPRTVMTLQNQIPRIIVCIILVTFSYGIAAVMIDFMWLTTYVGINVITSAGGTGTSPTNPAIPPDDRRPENDPNRDNQNLQGAATNNLLQMPLTYVNQVFRACDNQVDNPTTGCNGNSDSGIGHMTDEVSASIGAFLKELIYQFLNVNEEDSCFSLTDGLNINKCMANVLGFLAQILMWIIILITILRVLFQVWFTLLKAYTFVILYAILGPIFIVMGLLPGKPLGFEKWMRSMLANLAVFPLTAFLFVVARLFVDLFSTANADERFIPPLVGNPNIIGVMGWLIAFGLFLMTPTILSILQESLKVKGTPKGSAIAAGLAAGAAAPRAFAGAMWHQATRKAKLHEHDAGILRQWAAGKAPVSDALAGTTGNPSKMVNRIRKWRSKLYKFDASGPRGGGGGGH